MGKRKWNLFDKIFMSKKDRDSEDRLDIAIDRSVATIQELRDKKEKLVLQVEDLRAHNLGLTQGSARLSEENKVLGDGLEHAKHLVKRLREEHDALKSHCKEVNREKTALVDRVEELDKENQLAKSYLDKAVSLIGAGAYEIEKFFFINDDLKKMLSEYDKTLPDDERSVIEYGDDEEDKIDWSDLKEKAISFSHADFLQQDVMTNLDEAYDVGNEDLEGDDLEDDISSDEEFDDDCSDQEVAAWRNSLKTMMKECDSFAQTCEPDVICTCDSPSLCSCSPPMLTSCSFSIDHEETEKRLREIRELNDVIAGRLDADEMIEGRLDANDSSEDSEYSEYSHDTEDSSGSSYDTPWESD